MSWKRSIRSAIWILMFSVVTLGVGPMASAQVSRQHLEKARRELRSKVGEISTFMSSCIATMDQSDARVLDALVCDGERVLSKTWLIEPEGFWTRSATSTEGASFLMGVMMEFGFEVKAVIRTGGYDHFVFQRTAKSRQIDSQSF
ncbi:MAG TPA: hypothetical protein PLZ57_16220 [Pseudobdellovibrionaceae bacterium]|nr:hypothetical protein [Pseudobdellovibrionaceae bacterium]